MTLPRQRISQQRGGWSISVLARLAVATVALGAWACTIASTVPLVVPPWMEPAARWRARLPAEEESRLDRALVATATGYRSRHGDVLYREFAVLPPHDAAAVVDAVDKAVASAGRKLARSQPSVAEPQRQEWRWTGDGDAKPVILIWLPMQDAAVREVAGFALLFEPK